MTQKKMPLLPRGFVLTRTVSNEGGYYAREVSRLRAAPHTMTYAAGQRCACYRCRQLRDMRARARADAALDTIEVRSTRADVARSVTVPAGTLPALADMRDLRDRVIALIRRGRTPRPGCRSCGVVACGCYVPADGCVRMPNGRRMPVRDALALGDAWKAALITSSSRRPATQENHVGVELEFGVPADDDGRALRLALVKAKLAGRAALGDDGSVSIPGRHTHELRLIAPETQIAAVVTAACEALAACDATVNATCGLHVHLDARNRDPAEMHARLYRALPWLYSIVSPSRRRNQYCRRNRSAQPDRSQRYLAINACAERAHGTIEVRLHHGTVDAAKIRHWILLLRRIVDTPAPPTRRPLKDLHSFAAYYQLPLSTMLYLAQRMQRFGHYATEGLSLPDVDVVLPPVLSEASEIRVA